VTANSHKSSELHTICTSCNNVRHAVSKPFTALHRIQRAGTHDSHNTDYVTITVRYSACRHRAQLVKAKYGNVVGQVTDYLDCLSNDRRRAVIYRSNCDLASNRDTSVADLDSRASDDRE
jgi:hypothetical protein